MPLTVPAESAQNTLIYLATVDSPATFGQPIARLGNIAATTSTKVVEVSNQTSPWVRRLATLHDGGLVTVPLFWLPSDAGDAALIAVFAQTPPQLHAYMIEWPDGVMWHFNAYITKWSPKSPIGGALTADLEFAIDGTVQFT